MKTIRFIGFLVILQLLFACTQNENNSRNSRDAEADEESVQEEADTGSDTGDEQETDGSVLEGKYHPQGFAAASAHGKAFNLSSENCQSCHGVSLEGEGDAVSCDLCHTPAEPKLWQTDCTFCHGGTDNATGAPPKNLDGSTDYQGSQFSAHTSHVTEGVAVGFDCIECHKDVTELFTDGHVLDDTPGVAEFDPSSGLSDQMERAGATCVSSYCHGNGQGDNGLVADETEITCGSCHAAQDSDPLAWQSMSGEHALHLGLDITCTNCHQGVTQDNASISGPALHVNKVKEVEFTEATISRNAVLNTCTGPCHGFEHMDDNW